VKANFRCPVYRAGANNVFQNPNLQAFSDRAMKIRRRSISDL
jgi:hypothetical protein